MTGEHDREHVLQEMEVEAFILILSALQYMMTSEQQMMAGMLISFEFLTASIAIVALEFLSADSFSFALQGGL